MNSSWIRYEFTMELFHSKFTYLIHAMSPCSSNRANQQGSACTFSWSGSGICRFYLSGPELWSVTAYYPFNLSANAAIKTVARFVRSCSSRRHSLPRLWWLQRLPLPLGRQKIRRLSVLFKCVSCAGAISFEELSWSISKPPAHANEQANSVSGLKSNNAAKATMQQNI